MENSHPTAIDRRTQLLLFLFVLAIVLPVVQTYRAQQASRYSLTASVWDNQTIILDELEDVVAIDIAVRDGHLYSDKAPLQPLLGVPLYGMYSAVGGESASTLRIDGNLGVWWQSVWFAAVPLAALALVLMNIVGRFYPTVALPAVLAFVCGTLLLPFGSLLFGHGLAALFIAGSVALLLSDEVDAARLLGAGALVGAAVATEYPAVLVGVVVGLFALWRARSRVAWFVAGGLPMAAMLAVYHTAAFGSPLSHPYRYSAFAGVPVAEKTFLDPFNGIRLDNLASVFFSGRGFFIATPIVIVGLIGLVKMVRREDTRGRAMALVALGGFAVMLAIPIFWGNPWGGSSPGARYMVPALPLVAVGLAAVWSSRPMWTKLAVTVSVVTMVLATITDPLITADGTGGVGRWVRLLVDGDATDTIFTMLIGPAGWILHGALVGALGWLLAREWKGSVLRARERDGEPAGVRQS